MAVERYPICSDEDDEFDPAGIPENAVDVDDPRLTLEVIEQNLEADAYATPVLQIQSGRSDEPVLIRLG